MRTCSLALLAVLLTSCSDEDAAPGGEGGDGGSPALCDTANPPAFTRTEACDAIGTDAPALTVRIVDETGAPAEASQAYWNPADSAEFWGGNFSTAATCADGAPPCSEWIVEAELPARVVFTAARTTEPSDTCYNLSSANVQLHVPDDLPQTITLTLPSAPTACRDENDALHPGPLAWQLPRAENCVTTPACGATFATIKAVNQADDAPLPTVKGLWYYPPDSAEFDGEHPLRCVDHNCEELALDEQPRAGLVYFTVNYVGPFHPEQQTSWQGYGATSIEYDPAAEPPVVVIPMEILESAIGG